MDFEKESLVEDGVRNAIMALSFADVASKGGYFNEWADEEQKKVLKAVTYCFKDWVDFWTDTDKVTKFAEDNKEMIKAMGLILSIFKSLSLLDPSTKDSVKKE